MAVTLGAGSTWSLPAVLHAQVAVPLVEARQRGRQVAAVLPFANISGQPADGWIGKGIAETVLGDLERGGQVTVVGPGTLLAEAARQGTPLSDGDDRVAIEIGRRLGVAWLVRGGYQRLGDQFRITARIINVQTGVVVKAAKVDGEISRIFELQDRIVAELGADFRSAPPAGTLPAETLPAALRADIDKAAADVLASTGAPSASIAVVRDGHVAYVHAYGLATIEPAVPATSEMRYSIGSVSKQFTAAAILLLSEEGKLSLDDKVGRWLPGLTRANEVTLRQVLSMTSGYQDFWPQDYVMPGMLLPTTPQGILDRWAKIPLDFEPGAKWQYSNTNYVIAGAIAEQASGMRLVEFLRKKVFVPLGMQSVADSDEAALGLDDPMRYLRYALGPPRPAPKEGKGWMFAAGELAMTARDLALWDIATIDRAVLKPASYQAMQTNVLLTNGMATGYGLGVQVGTSGQRRQISHTGEVSGFTAANTIYPDDHAAVVVLTNLDATGASSQIASRIAAALFRATSGDKDAEPALAQAKAVFDGLQHGKVDRALLTSNANAYFTAAALTDFASSLGPLGAPQEFEQASQSLRGGMTQRSFRIKCGARTLRVTTFTLADGKLEQFQIAPAE